MNQQVIFKSLGSAKCLAYLFRRNVSAQFHRMFNLKFSFPLINLSLISVSSQSSEAPATFNRQFQFRGAATDRCDPLTPLKALFYVSKTSRLVVG